MTDFKGTRANPRRKITASEALYITDNHDRMTSEDIACYLEVSTTVISRWLAEMGIKKNQVHRSRRAELVIEKNGFFVHDKRAYW